MNVLVCILVVPVPNQVCHPDLSAAASVYPLQVHSLPTRAWRVAEVGGRRAVTHPDAGQGVSQQRSVLTLVVVASHRGHQLRWRLRRLELNDLIVDCGGRLSRGRGEDHAKCMTLGAHFGDDAQMLPCSQAHVQGSPI